MVFPDANTYIGQSAQKLQTRLTQHKRGDSSQWVAALMPHLKAVYLHEVFDNRYDAWEAEKYLVSESKKAGWKVLNKDFTPIGWHFEGAVSYERVLGKYRCRICKTWKKPEHFHKDPSRSSGRCNQCKTCKSNWGKVRNHAKKLGVVPKDNPVLFETYRNLKGHITVDSINWSNLIANAPDI